MPDSLCLALTDNLRKLFVLLKISLELVTGERGLHVEESHSEEFVFLFNFLNVFDSLTYVGHFDGARLRLHYA